MPLVVQWEDFAHQEALHHVPFKYSNDASKTLVHAYYTLMA